MLYEVITESIRLLADGMRSCTEFCVVGIEPDTVITSYSIHYTKLYELAEGAGGRTVDEISRGFEDLGAVYANSAGKDNASLNLRSLVDPELLKPALENLRLVFTRPDFPEDSFELV